MRGFSCAAGLDAHGTEKNDGAELEWCAESLTNGRIATRAAPGKAIRAVPARSRGVGRGRKLSRAGHISPRLLIPRPAWAGLRQSFQRVLSTHTRSWLLHLWARWRQIESYPGEVADQRHKGKHFSFGGAGYFDRLPLRLFDREPSAVVLAAGTNSFAGPLGLLDVSSARTGEMGSCAAIRGCFNMATIEICSPFSRI
jgi:hypothetical protein